MSESEENESFLLSIQLLTHYLLWPTKYYFTYEGQTWLFQIHFQNEWNGGCYMK